MAQATVRLHPATVIALFLLLALAPPVLGAAAQSGAACTVHYEDGLVLDGGATRVLENEVVCLIGRIVIRDEATLVIRHSRLVTRLDVPNPWGYGTEIVLFDSAHLELDDVLIQTEERNFSVDAHDVSSVTIRDVREAAGSGLLDVNAFHEAVVAVANSHLGGARVADQANFELSDSGIEEVALEFAIGRTRVGDLQPSEHAFWDSGALTTDYEGFSLLIEGCAVAGWSVAVSGTASVEVHDSELVITRMDVEGASGVLDGYAARSYTSWSSADVGLVSALSLSFQNSEVTDYVAFVAHGQTDIEIHNCSFGWLCFTEGYADVSVVGTAIGNLGLFGVFGEMVFSDSVFQGCLHAEGALMSWRGDLSVDEACVLRWNGSMISREISASVVGGTGEPVQGAEVDLLKADGATASAVTNAEGTATFQVWFSDSNFLEPRTLSVYRDGQTQSAGITFLSNSFVIFRR